MSYSAAKAILIPASILFASASITHVYNEDFGRKQKENFQNNSVQSISGYTFIYENGTPVKKGTKTSVEHFDEKGNRTVDVFFNQNGETMSEFTHSFNDDGIELKSVGMINHKATYNFWAYNYNDSTGTLEKYHTKQNLFKEKWIYKFNKEGSKTEEQYFDTEGYLLSRKVFLYDSKTRLSEKIEFDAYDNLFEKWAYSYDEKGNNTKQVQYNADSEMLNQFSLVYDEKGNLTTRIVTNSKGVTQEMTVYLYQFFSATETK